MEKLFIYSPQNERTKNYRDYNLFFDDLTEKLKSKYEVIEYRYSEHAHTDRTKYKIKNLLNEFIELMECEYLIQKENGDFYILSVSEQISSAILTEQNNSYLKKVLYSQYIPDQMVHHCKENTYKYLPWIFFPQNVNNFDKYYDMRKKINFENQLSNLFFKGNTTYRPIVNLIDKNILSSNKILKELNYFEELINYRISLSIGGTANGDLCYRDIECMALGVPLLRFDFVTTLNPALIPNYHYVSIPLQLDLPIVNDVLKDRLGIEKHAKLIEDKFKQVINNENMLNFISKNAREYYEKYLSPKNRVDYTLELLGL